ncbi:MAG: DUF5110 domain-containing protein, partial [Deltaproteobacteria bacterium]|nr:DUF5110 domain-containing protein [Deltaproteobacteria bacterium]
TYKGQISGLIDYTNLDASSFMHSQYRAKLLEKGFTAYFLEGGEPESYSSQAWYQGAGSFGEHSHYAWANRFSFRWMESVWRGIFPEEGGGFRLYQNEPRVFMLTRSGLGGQSRFGAGFYYLDPNLLVLLTEGVARSNLSVSGLDYLTPDVFPYLKQFPLRVHNQSYAAWLGRNALIATPLLIPRSFLRERWARANLFMRERLTPYFYSLAHEANQNGSPLVAPLLHYFQADPVAREATFEAMVGPHLLVAAGVRAVDDVLTFILPAGRWYDVFGRQVIEQESTGPRTLPCKQRGVTMAPLLLKAGAILPTKPENAEEEERFHIVAFPGNEASHFDVYDDNGSTFSYITGEMIKLRLDMAPDAQANPPTLTLTIRALEGSWPGQSLKRGFIIELVGLDNPGTAVLDGKTFIRVNREEDLIEHESAWFYPGGGRLIFKTPELDLTEDHALVVR